MITYADIKGGLAVYLDGKRCGTIKAVFGGWAYFPGKRPGKDHGECFAHLFQVKRSIESDE